MWVQLGLGTSDVESTIGKKTGGHRWSPEVAPSITTWHQLAYAPGQSARKQLDDRSPGHEGVFKVTKRLVATAYSHVNQSVMSSQW